mgnify:CR=1 FL=1
MHLVNDSFQPSSPSVNAGATQPSRLGVYLEGDGVDIAVTAPNAQAVEVCFSLPENLQPKKRATDCSDQQMVFGTATLPG